MIGIVDYGMGNLRSVEKAFEYVGYEAKIIKDVASVKEAHALVLPGVGAFPDAMDTLVKTGMAEEIKRHIEKGKPFLGICLGMQLLFEKSFEVEETGGFKIFKGEVVELPKYNKIPHMGWNSLTIKKETPLLKGIKSGDYVYFVHSYYVVKNEKEFEYAVTEYGIEIPAVVIKDNVFSCQFHPEKSGETGLNILKNFGEMIKCF
ncbi:MAG TPA: imidazole glycerol phosphate synthase subunit HisH [Clostridia bacterium]|nr:imidazole glycerol phosphate synthase subunit HisH [Clostridia bacterium]